jgi:uncharacterized protein YfaQ (DUF2300 family)
MQQLGVAEREAQRALELCPGTNWARHALAHVLDAQGRHEEGRHMLGQTRNIWTVGARKEVLRAKGGICWGRQIGMSLSGGVHCSGDTG